MSTAVTTPEAIVPEAVVERLAELGAVMFPLRAGLKTPAIRRWQRAAPMTAAQAVRELSAARNLAVNLAASDWIAVDTESQAGTDAMIALGYQPWSYPAKSNAGETLADGSPNLKRGGAHFVFIKPARWGSAWSLPTNRTGFRVAGGQEHDKFDVLAGARYVVVPPSMLVVANGAQYTPGEGFFEPIPEAPAWLFDRSVPCPSPALAAADGCMIPDPSHVREAREATDLDMALDQVSDDEWFRGYEHLLYPTGEEDEDGCPTYSWHTAGNDKAATSHACEVHGRKVKMWGSTMPNDLGFEPQATVTHLNLRAALRGVPVAEVMREMGIISGNGDLTTEALGLPPLTSVPVDDAASLVAFEARAAACRAVGDGTGAYHWAQRASLCTLALRARRTFDDRQRAAAEASGEVFIEPATVVGMSMLTPQQVESVTAPLPDGASAFHAITLPAAPARPVQQDPGPYPVDALPDAVRDFALETAELMNVPPALAAVPMLSTLVAACGPAHIWVRPRWEAEPGALWFGVVAPPGAKKTPILKAAQDALGEAANRIDEALAGERRQAMIRAKAAVKAADAVESEAEDGEAERLAGRRLFTKKKDTTAAVGLPADGAAPAIGALGVGWTPPDAMVRNAIAEAAELRRLAEEAEDAVPAKAMLVIGDATPEKLHELLSTQHGRGYVVLSEGGRTLKAAARDDAKAMDISFWLDARDEASIIVHRIGRGDVVCEMPSMCVLLMVQPDVWKAVMARRGDGPSPLEANGFLDRYLLTVIPEVSPDVFFHDEEADPTLKEAYQELIISQFVGSYLLLGERLKFRLTREAQNAFAPIYEYIESVAKSGCGVRAQMWDKAAGSVVRLARVFAQAEYRGDELEAEGEYPIHPEHIVAAWRVIYWHLCSYGYSAGTAAAATEAELAEAAMRKVREALAEGPKPWKGGLQNLRAVRTQKARIDAAVEAKEILLGEDGLYSLP